MKRASSKTSSGTKHPKGKPGPKKKGGTKKTAGAKKAAGAKKSVEEIPASTESAETRLLVRFGFELAREVGIGKVLVLAELVRDRRLVERHRDTETLIWVTREAQPGRKASHERYVEVPAYRSDRLSQLTMALIVAVLRGVIDPAESVVCLTGVAGSKRLDNLLIANPKRDFSWFSHHTLDTVPRALARTREFIRLLEIALQLAAEGREGKPVGTILVLSGDDSLDRYSRQLILNPLKGHRKKTRNIHDPDFLESVRELSALDGAFIIASNGVVERAGAYLDAPVTKTVTVPPGLGSRHVAAAALTANTDATAIVISESSGTITVFCLGEKVMHLEGRASQQ